MQPLRIFYGNRGERRSTMNDREIIRLYFERNESAITETQKNYGRYLKKIAFNILGNTDDCDECLNDTYFCIWNKIPPASPENFTAFAAKIAREKAIDIYRKKSSLKRTGNFAASLEELSECIPDSFSTEAQVNLKELGNEISEFLKEQTSENCDIFMKRYFHCYSLKEISDFHKINITSLKSRLHRMRKDLKKHLEKEGFDV